MNHTLHKVTDVPLPTPPSQKRRSGHGLYNLNRTQEKVKTKCWILVLASAMTAICHAQTNFAISTPNAQFAFLVNGTNNSPTLTLTAGATYMFVMNTTPNFHPVAIATTNTLPAQLYSGDAVQAPIFSGTNFVTIPPTNFPTNLWYICAIHGFFGKINVIPPVATPPPPNTIISIVLSRTNVTVTSTGTSTSYAFVPQFSSNLLSGTWLDVSNFANVTNTFANGTNTTVFDRLDPICGPGVFIRISQEPPH
jgi:hypothetical protein